MIKAAFPPGLVSIFTATMENIVVAEDMIKEKIRKHPDKEADINNAFMSLLTPELLRGKHPKLYDHHVSELLERVVSGKTGIEFSYGTKAETLCALLGTALKAPLARDHSALSNKLFEEIFGGLPDGTKVDTTESYAGALDELLHDICRLSLKDADRKLR